MGWMGFFQFFVYLVFFVSEVGADELGSHHFSNALSIDGREILYEAKDEDFLSKRGQSVALALHDNRGPWIFYDEDLMASFSPLAKFLILEHERAHHYLGHSLFTKAYREEGEMLPASFLFRKEKDADCAAGYRVAELMSDLSRNQIQDALVEVFAALGGDAQRILPAWLYSRIDTISTCFEGKLLPYPARTELPSFEN